MASVGQIKQLVIDKFDSEGLRYQDVGRGDQEVLSVGMRLHFASIDILIFFDEDGNSLHLSTMLPFEIPSDKLPGMLMAVNELNKNYRWIDFYVDMSDNTVMGEMDAVVDAQTAGDEIFELVMRMCSIVDSAYPAIMMAMFKD